MIWRNNVNQFLNVTTKMLMTFKIRRGPRWHISHPAAASLFQKSDANIQIANYGISYQN